MSLALLKVLGGTPANKGSVSRMKSLNNFSYILSLLSYAFILQLVLTILEQVHETIDFYPSRSR